MSLKINIFGDFVPIERGVLTITNAVAIDKSILSIIRDTDYNLVNLECPIVRSENARKIVKAGPCLKCDENAVRYLKESGFNMVTLANNHLNDYGQEGVYDTFEVCRQYDMDFVGAGNNIVEARKPQIIEIKGVKIGIINVCENESSIATNESPGSNPIDEINNYYDIVQLLSKVDKVIVILHGGVEHYRLPSPKMMKLCHFYADLGVSAIVCHHTHCYSGYEVYHGVPMFYSLGNFFFDRVEKPKQWKSGYFVQLDFSEGTNFKIYPYIQCDTDATVRLMTEEEQESFHADIKNINTIIADEDALEKKYDEWLNKRYRYYISAAQTWAGRYYKAAYRRKLLPAGITKRNAMHLLNYIRCESHHDLLINALNRYLFKK